MITLQVLCEITDVASFEVERWVASALIRPEGTGFRDIDVARIRLICELRELGLDEEALPVVLGLLDQLYGTREQLRRLLSVLEVTLPADVRSAVLERFLPE